MKKITIAIVVLFIVWSSIVWAVASEWKNSENTTKSAVVLNPIPKSLDTSYPAGNPPIYLKKMFDMATPMEAIAINAQEGDWTNANISFQAFSAEYINNSKLVPEWEHYFDMGIVKNIGNDIDAKSPAVFADIGSLGQSCEKCHTENKFQVWVQYNWKNFDKINVNTTNPAEPIVPWTDAMEKYLAPSFDGMPINLAEGKRDAANQSFDAFRAQLLNFKDACKECHGDVERKYFGDNDTIAIVDQLGVQVKAGNLAGVGPFMGQIGNDVCYKCHVIHEPAQKIRTLMEK